MAESEDLYQVALLIDQLKHEDVHIRANAFKSIELIAAALGADRTREELVPFIAESLEDEDDVVSVIADNIGKLISFIGPSDHLYVLLQPLQVLVCGEDNEIRDRALAATEDLIRRMTRSQIITHLLPMLKELSSKDWYTARSACALLCPAVFQLVDEDNRSVVLSLLSRCATDSTPSVRRSAAKALPKLAPSASPNHIQEIAQLFAVLAKDDQDSIRIQCIQADVALAVYFTIELQTKIIVPCAVAWSGDRSWRVRWSLGHHLHDLVGHIQEKNAAINPDVTKAVIVTLCTVYDSLLNDSEPEVRASSVSHFSALCSFLSRDAIHQLMVSVQRLCGDSSDFVRAAAATELSLLCTMLGREDTVNLLLPSLLQLLRDERSEVRLNIIAQLHSINDAIGVDALSQSLLPALSELGLDAKWRVRLAVIEHMPMIAKQLGQAFFNDKLINLCLQWLSDRVFSVRKAAALSLCHLTVLFGGPWALANILPALQAMRQNSSCAQRLTVLAVAYSLLSEEMVVKDSSLVAALLYLASDMANDPVANVRLSVAKVLGVLPDRAERMDVKSTIIKLASDSDRDVRFFATKAISW